MFNVCNNVDVFLMFTLQNVNLQKLIISYKSANTDRGAKWTNVLLSTRKKLWWIPDYPPFSLLCIHPGWYLKTHALKVSNCACFLRVNWRYLNLEWGLLKTGNKWCHLFHIVHICLEMLCWMCVISGYNVQIIVLKLNFIHEEINYVSTLNKSIY